MKKQIFLIMLALMALSAEVAMAKSAAGLIQMDFDLSAQAPDKEVRLWLPYPISSEYQDISEIKIIGDFEESGVYADKKYQTPMLYARWPVGKKSRHLSLSFKAVRQEVLRRNFPAAESAWSPTDYKLWLSPSSLGPIDGQVKELSDEIVKGKNGVLNRARAIYDWTCENMYREPATVGCGKGDVCSLLKTPGGKCTDIHSVFVALCRAAGIPAREIFGIRLAKKPIQDITKWQHCWAEFYLPGYGWVPVDPADVRKLMLKRNLNLADQGAKDLKSYFWGGWDAYRVKLAVGRDLTLSPPQAGGLVNTLGYPYAEAAGIPLDFYDPGSFSYTFKVKRMDAE